MSLWNKRVSKEEFDELEVEENYEKVESMNGKYNLLIDNTKLLIVGTITPPNGAGFYYTSKYNRIFGYIDQALGTQLKEKKIMLINENNSDEKKKIINEIVEELDEVGIAFIDVVKEAIRKKESSLDTDIKHVVLDYEAFNDLKNVEHIICNSNDAFECFNNITNNRYSPILLSQRRTRKEIWLNKLKEYTKWRLVNMVIKI